MVVETVLEEKKLLNKVIILVFFERKKYSRSFIKLRLTTALTVSVTLLSTEGQKTQIS